MPFVPASKTALIQTNARISLDLIAKHTGAVSIRTMKHEGGWMHMIECDRVKDFDSFNAALSAIEDELKPRSKCLFRSILDDGGSTEGKIILNPSFIQDFKSEETWKRPRSDEKQSRKRDSETHPKPYKKQAADTRSETIASKDEIIKALNIALEAKDELIRTQAALIQALQR
jgi:hypothetical protein